MRACISLWGDNAPYSARSKDSVFLLTWRLLTGRKRDRLWALALPKKHLGACGCFGRRSFDAAFVVLAYSFRALLAGSYPMKDRMGDYFQANSWRGQMAGQRLRIRGACLAKPGDWAWLKQIVGLCGWKEGRGRCCCWLCSASFTSGSYDDASLQADWRRTIHNMNTIGENMAARGMFCSKAWATPGLRIEWLTPALCMWSIWESILTSAAISAGICLSLWAGGDMGESSTQVAFAPK
jgi:hypothetical protein